MGAFTNFILRIGRNNALRVEHNHYWIMSVEDAML